ncbi:MAG TPA: glycoside hydrolase family 9 protein, partial [Gemmatimonadales bacterium]|nr:glycoside hydrolase family 9 protein [Gemmatimonadales bacterium]
MPIPRTVLTFLVVGSACHPATTPVQVVAPAVVIRVNQVGYLPEAPKVAVVCALERRAIVTFRVVDARDRTVLGPGPARAAGPFGPCVETYRLDFSAVRAPGVYTIEAGGARSLPVRIGDDVYRGAADSLLAYLREQQSGYNPVFRDSVHERSDGILVDHPSRGGEFIAVSGGWADASDYLQYGA